VAIIAQAHAARAVGRMVPETTNLAAAVAARPELLLTPSAKLVETPDSQSKAEQSLKRNRSRSLVGLAAATAARPQIRAAPADSARKGCT